MKTDEIRTSYLEFFQKKAHRYVSSDSLVPQNDPTLLFTGAGMNQFKDYFLGLKKDMTRATSSQKCLRTGDLEEVGKTAYHHSFFEMLGNFSFGDYFKAEAIAWAWEYLTQVLKIPVSRLRITVHETDDEAYNIWKNTIKIRPDWLYKMGDKSNFWPANAPKDGPNGPCGPCSEIYFDQDPSQGEGGHIEDKRFAEIWNLVFTQYDRQDGGKLVPLAQKNIDTGMGLERLACVLQGKSTNYETDNFQKINAAVARELKIKQTPENATRIYAVSDHARAVVFSIGDGVIPSNDGRGYVIRKLIRRALWHGYEATQGGLEKPFLYAVVDDICAVMGKVYPEIVENKQSIVTSLKGEEERFLVTLERGLDKLHDYISNPPKGVHGKLDAAFAFELYDTYGFPYELTRKIASEKGWDVDEKGFERLMEEQRKRAKDATKISGAIFTVSDLEKKISGLAATRFLGYESLESKARVLFAEVRGGEGVAVLDQTPFYAESGGQVGDWGVLEGRGFRGEVTDTVKKDQLFIHHFKVLSGTLKIGDEVTAKIDAKRRDSIMRNHTATHLLHAALRKLLGTQVRQLGSLVAPDRLRFDYSYSQALSDEQVRAIEDAVNEQILLDADVTKEEKSIELAKADGAIAFFGEKYGDRVRVVTVPDFSKEFCGGTHCHSTGQIGSFYIVSDSSIASGTRRIEAVTGSGAVLYARNLRGEIGKLAELFKTSPSGVADRVVKLQESVKKLEKEKRQGVTATADPKNILSSALAAGKIRFASYRLGQGAEVEDLRRLSDAIRSMSEKTVYFLGTENEEKIHYVIGLSPDLGKSSLDAREAMKALSNLLNGSGGGRKELVQGGAKNEGQFQNRWNDIVENAVRYLKEAEV